jgi:branched-chain amino acid transport system substrate-binding protein
VTAHTITLGGVLDQTNVGSVVARPILGGYELAVKQVNATGGINGRTISYTALNDNEEPSQTLSQIKQLVESDGVFAILGVFGTPSSEAAAPYLNERHIPLFDPIGGVPGIKRKPWIWATEPDLALEGKVMANYVATTLHATRVAMLYQVGFGEQQLAAVRLRLPRYGASLVAQASFAPTDSNLSGQVLRLRAANPDMVIVNGAPPAAAAFVQYARLLNFKPKDGFMFDYPKGDPLWLTLVGASADGSYLCTYADLTGHNAWARAYSRAIATYHGDSYSNYGGYGYFNAMLFFRALRLAGKHLTRSGLQHALDTQFRDYRTGFSGEINWTPTQHYGSRQFKIYRIRHARFVPLSGWLSP